MHARSKFVVALLLSLTLLVNFSACYKKIQTSPNRPSALGRAAFIIDEHLDLKEPVIELMRLTNLKEVHRLRDAISPTQTAWLRPAHSERADLTEQHADTRLIMQHQFSSLGIVSEVQPDRAEYDYFFVLGAMYETMITRINFLEQILAAKIKVKNIAMLGSHRPLEPMHEIGPMLKSHTFKTMPVTEIQMMEALMASPSLKKLTNGINIITIASSMKENQQGEVVRANTRDTVVDLLKLKLAPGSALVISSQPYVLRQDLVVRALMTSPWQIETVGPKAPSYLPTNVYLDELARILYELRGFYGNHGAKND